MCYRDLDKKGMKMKIPNTGSGNGYYGHETGVIPYLENSAGEPDVQAAGEEDFSDYMWMENEEEFDKQVLQQLEEEELMEECLEAMLEDERQHDRNRTSGTWSPAVNAPETSSSDLCQQLGTLRVRENTPKQIRDSKLNPNAAEFIPAFKTSASKEISSKSS